VLVAEEACRYEFEDGRGSPLADGLELVVAAARTGALLGRDFVLGAHSSVCARSAACARRFASRASAVDGLVGTRGILLRSLLGPMCAFLIFASSCSSFAIWLLIATTMSRSEQS
jgi:hypothetical protein